MKAQIKSGKTLFTMQKGIAGIDDYLGPDNYENNWVIVSTLPSGRKVAHLILDTEQAADAAMEEIAAEVAALG